MSIYIKFGWVTLVVALATTAESHAALDPLLKGLRVNDAQITLVERREIKDFATFLAQNKSPASLQRARWWVQLSERLPASLMDVDVVEVPPPLRAVLGARPELPPSEALLGRLLFRALRAEIAAARPQALRYAQGTERFETLITAAFGMPSHVLTIEGLEGIVADLLNRDDARERVLGAMTTRPWILWNSREVRRRTLRVASARGAAPYATRAAAFRAIMRAPRHFDPKRVLRLERELIDLAGRVTAGFANPEERPLVDAAIAWFEARKPNKRMPFVSERKPAEWAVTLKRILNEPARDCDVRLARGPKLATLLR